MESHAFMPISIYAVSPEEFDKWTDCVQNDKAEEFYPSRACVQQLDFDAKYRKPLKDVHIIKFANTNSNTDKNEGAK